ncbi:hypothetical protein [Polymorphobacter sp.]|uniref:hypothetical protein n=1 Tax=Polymorphobacter sp. TaxID=1909290 RepID=UPI003F70EF52
MTSQAIKLSAKERTNLRYALRSHPDVLTQVGKLSDISALNKTTLLEAAQELGIDIEAAKAGDHLARAAWDSPEAAEQRRRSEEKPAFVGSFEEPMTFELLGSSITRTLRVSYELTPFWPYVDDETGEEVQGWEQSSMRYDFLIRREVGVIGSGPGGKARQRREKKEWVNCTELFIHQMLGDDFDKVIDDKIEEMCRRENKARKRRHGIPELVWRFEIGNIVVCCEEQKSLFAEPLNYNKGSNDPAYHALVEDIESGKVWLSDFVATVTRNGYEIGKGSDRQRVLPASETNLRPFRNLAVRNAISAAREHESDA